MGAGVQDMVGPGKRSERASATLMAEIFSDLDAVEALWRRMEADPACLYTPYQQFDWIAAYLRGTGTANAGRFAVLRDSTGRPRILLPLCLQRVRGVVIARSIGDDYANFQLPLFSANDAAAIPFGEVVAALVKAGRKAGIDAYSLRHQPRMWEGAANPLAQPGEREASDAYGLLLGPDPEATVRRVFSADTRKKLRSKEKRLVEAFGAVEYRLAGSAAEAAKFLAAFYVQKAARLAGMGLADPYAAAPVRAFLAAATMGNDPSVEIHVLRVVETGRVLATFGGAVSNSRYSGMMTSFDPDPEVSRFSPGELLLHHLVRDQTARGRQGFDLGVGEARYKASICDETIELVETVLPVTLRGRAYSTIRIGFMRARRRIKRDPRLYAAVVRVRKLRGA